jgi:hypothetical protein
MSADQVHGSKIIDKRYDSHEDELSAPKAVMRILSTTFAYAISAMAISISHMFFAAPTNPVKSVSNMVRLIFPMRPAKDHINAAELGMSDPFYRTARRLQLHAAALKRQAKQMSALGQQQTFAAREAMSALPPKADIGAAQINVRFGLKADIAPPSGSILKQG